MPTYSQHKLLIANRGEIACRIIDTCRRMGIPTLAIYAGDDATARFVQMADESAPLNGLSLSESYLDKSQIIEIAKKSGATLIHPGYGFLSENADFARAVMDNGLSWIGPTPAVIEQMGSKVLAKQEAEKANVPTAKWAMIEHANRLSEDELTDEAQRVGFPLLVKASGGGGGKGMRLVTAPKQLHEAYEACMRVATSAFGDPTLFLERYIEPARHIEVQILGDHHGHLIHMGDRECSVQRRHQKIIEEAPAPNLPEKTRERIRKAAVAFGKKLAYSSAGTVEFIVDTNGDFYFLEVNTRLQVEHPVTEWVTGIDLVEQQIHVALNEPLAIAQEDIVINGHAIEARIYAEDPYNGFLPTPGVAEFLEWPTAPHLRIDTGIIEKSLVSSNYDPMVAKLSAWGGDRDQAIANMAQALLETTILGFIHNVDFLRDIIQTKAFRESKIYTNSIENELLAQLQPACDESMMAPLLFHLLESKQPPPAEETEMDNLFATIQL